MVLLCPTRFQASFCSFLCAHEGALPRNLLLYQWFCGLLWFSMRPTRVEVEFRTDLANPVVAPPQREIYKRPYTAICGVRS